MPAIVSVKRIWDSSHHNAFTDLIRFQGGWLCVFRQATAHEIPDGTIQVLTSSDGDTWNSIAVVSEQGIDLRDPKLSVTPDGRLTLLMGGSIYEDGEYITRAPRVSFSQNGFDWTAPKRLLAEDHWLWRATWHEGRAYSLSKLGEGDGPRRGFLYSSPDGIEWEWITEFKIPGVSETTLRFMSNGDMVALIRPTYIGWSQEPYRDWSFTDLKINIGGPNFVQLPNGSLWATARYSTDQGSQTVLARMTKTSFEPVLALPSGGDCSYAGMVWHDGLLWMSYYSSHEGKTSIYLARIRLPTR